MHCPAFSVDPKDRNCCHNKIALAGLTYLFACHYALTYAVISEDFKIATWGFAEIH